MTYRILSSTAILGYGFPPSSLECAMDYKLDLIACDAGSIDAGPYYLGAGESYVAKEAIKRDFSLLLDAAIDQRAPLLIGNCGFCGDSPHLKLMLEIVTEVLAQKNPPLLKLALIDSHIDPQILIGNRQGLEPIGRIPSPTQQVLHDSRLVAQMGIAPFIHALDAKADIVLAGRACDVAIFAAAPIRKGYPAGLCYHAGHILECGAIACEPGSGSDSIIAEFSSDKKSVSFIAPNRQRITTPRSIAAHSLYEESHPALQAYPEGILSLKDTRYLQRTSRIAAIENSRFIPKPTSIKLEGSQCIGVRHVALIPATPNVPLSPDYLVYGKNAISTHPLQTNEQELGILIWVEGKESVKVKALASLLEAAFLHFGYEGRKTTAGNIAYALSPSVFSFKDKDKTCALVLGGTRSEEFIQQYQHIKTSILLRMQNDYPSLMHSCRVSIDSFNANRPLIFIDSVADDKNKSRNKQQALLHQLKPYIDIQQQGFTYIYANKVYTWSVFHVINDAALIKKMFPITFYAWSNNALVKKNTVFPHAIEMAEPIEDSLLDESIDSLNARVEPRPTDQYRALKDMASIIRSKNAGVSVLSYDIFFNSVTEYHHALASGIFNPTSIASILNRKPSDIVGCYRVDSCMAIKISCYRDILSGAPGTRDVFGAQQQMPLTQLKIPVHKTQ